MSSFLVSIDKFVRGGYNRNRKKEFYMEEKIVKKGAANWVRGIGTKGGHLILTTKSIYFEGHKINLGTKQNEIMLKDIQNVETKFFNSLIITASNGERFEYLVNKRKDWDKIIRETIANN